jgi:hypothetical protein
MGISGLTTKIAPYGERVTYIVTPSPPLSIDTGVDVIIDGPSFSHFIYSKCLASNFRTRGTFEALPFYGELGDAALAWLRQLETFGLRVYVSSHIVHNIMLINK